MLALTMGMLALALTYPAEIRPYTDQTHVKKGTYQCLHDFMVKVSAIKGMGVGNDGKTLSHVIARRLVDSQFQTAHRALNKEAFSLSVQAVVLSAQRGLGIKCEAARRVRHR